jgi:hypothetical protein
LDVELSILLFGAGILTGALIFSVLVERLLRKIGITPVSPHERPNGIRDVFTRLDRWRQSRENPDR